MSGTLRPAGRSPALNGLLLTVLAFAGQQAANDKGEQMNDPGDQAKGDKREHKEGKKRKKASAQSGKNEIDHGISPFLQRKDPMNWDF
jgi:hypothetical protein